MGKVKRKKAEIDTVVADFGTDFLNLYLPVPAWTVKEITDGKMARVIASANGISFPCALRPNREGDFYITLSKEKIKQMGVMPGSPVTVILVPDDSEYGFPVPEEFEELMLQDPEVKAMFDKITPGNRRGWLYYIASAKSVDTRIKRSLEIAEKLRALS